MAAHLNELAGEDLVQGYEQTTQVRGLHQVLGRILF